MRQLRSIFLLAFYHQYMKMNALLLSVIMLLLLNGQVVHVNFEVVLIDHLGRLTIVLNLIIVS